MEIEREIRKFISETILYNDKSIPLTNDLSFLQSGIIDSTGVLELVEFVEKKLHIEIGDDELLPENFDSIEKICHFVSNKLNLIEVTP